MIVRRRPAAGWWRLSVSPLLLATATALVVGVELLHDVAAVLQRAERLRQQVAVARSQVMAEAALARRHGDEAASIVDGVRVEREPGGWSVELVAPATSRLRFVADELPGAGPAAFGRAATVREPASGVFVQTPATLGTEAWPQLDAAAVERASRPGVCAALQRDRGIALLHRAVGTDQDDFVLAAGRVAAKLDVATQVLVVTGHLWVEPGGAPLVVELPRDLTIVVVGNLYLGRSVRTTGPGRLVVVARPSADAVAFVDCEGDGQFGPGDRLLGAERFRGPVEGGGSVYFGLRQDASGIDFAGSLVVGGQLHLLVDGRVAGPLVLGHGVSVLGGRHRLHAAGDWAFLPERERIPGFATTGRPRPGRLQLDSQKHATMRNQTLYVSAVGR
ncbi:MAG: hypothetical protein MUC36_14890 [Planctomycetes bacterium]|jgi:hypothetical protein|nr:hypothetical protein [Planctomycetota bacterium]